MTEPVTEKTFRLTAKRVMLTYKTHIPKDILEDFLKLKRACDFIRCAHETGDTSHDYPHTHVVIEFHTPPNFKDCRVFDFDDIHPNIEIAKNLTHFKRMKKYIAKEDPENDDLKDEDDRTFAEKIWSFDTVQEMLKSIGPDCVTAALQIWANKPLPEMPKREVEWREWQNEVFALLSRPVGRQIFWICDTKGNSGKSFLAEWLEDNAGALLLTQMGGARDSATIVKGALDRGWDGSLTVIDLPRQVKDKAIYEPIEMVKNGRMTAIKYQGGTMRWEKGHVVVFANFLPYVGQWSADRYAVFEIDRTHLRGITLEELPRRPTDENW